MIYAIAIGDKNKEVFVSSVRTYDFPINWDGVTTTVGITTAKKIAMKFWTRKGAQSAIEDTPPLRKLRDDGNEIVRPFFLWSLF